MRLDLDTPTCSVIGGPHESQHPTEKYRLHFKDAGIYVGLVASARLPFYDTFFPILHYL